MKEFYYPYHHQRGNESWCQVRALPCGAPKAMEGRVAIDFLPTPFAAMTLSQAYNSAPVEIRRAA